MRYKIFPPYIDAYRTGDASREEIERAMIRHAKEWGEQSIGAGVISGRGIAGEGLGIVVLCCAVTDDFDLLCVAEPGNDWWDSLRIIDGIVEYEWDAT
jgi:hypothetical protein